MKSLDEAKQEIRRRFLGRHGIHAVGISQKPVAVRVYSTGPLDGAGGSPNVLAAIRETASPHAVVVKVTRPAKASGDQPA
jgi:hypothetical protein